MIAPNSIIYIETSAVNYLSGKYSGLDGKATRIYHSLKGTKFYASPLTINEILLTNDELKKEILIFYLQNIGYHKLINSPSEFIINYILAGCPKVETKYDFHSKLAIANTWAEICDNTNKTFIYNKEEQKQKSKLIINTFKLASKQIGEVGLITPENKHQMQDQLWLESLLKNLRGINYNQIDSTHKKLFKISILLILFILCSEVDVDSIYTKLYWSKIGITKTKDRLNYLIKNHEALIYRGPLFVCAQMALVQLEKGGKPTRGIFWDILHSIYLIYVDTFFTNDDHFKKLSKSNDHPIFKRILHMDDVSWFTAKEIAVDRDKIIKDA
ncbi:MAG TPA: hypothetical protein VF411_13570 [Bacteroidia bacterium]